MVKTLIVGEYKAEWKGIAATSGIQTHDSGSRVQVLNHLTNQQKNNYKINSPISVLLKNNYYSGRARPVVRLTITSIRLLIQPVWVSPIIL